ncbi:MAG: hypothetical protein WCX64_06860 [Candidatus Micrarchaeia archaeon]
MLFFVFCFGFLQPAAASYVIVQNGQLNASGNFFAGNGALFVNSTSGYVGIGTTLPGRPLQIAAAQDAILRLQDTSGAGPAAYVEFYNDTSRWGYVGLGGHDDKMVLGTTIEKSLAFYTNDSPKMVLTAAGNLGIGTASPGYALVVNNSNPLFGSADTGYLWDGSNTTNYLKINSGSNVGGIVMQGSDIYSPSLFWSRKTTNSTDVWYAIGMNGAKDLHLDIAVQPTGYVPNVLYVKNNGNVGIGTTSPTYLLDVNGRAKATSVAVTSGVGDLINNAPWYGIGVHNTLDLGGGEVVQLAGWGGLTFQTGAGQMVIKQNGNVGIGTTSPAAKLDVAGSANIGGTVNGAIMTSGSVQTSGSWTDIPVNGAGILILKGTYGSATYAIVGYAGSDWNQPRGCALLTNGAWCSGYPQAQIPNQYSNVQVKMTGSECDGNMVVYWTFIGR